MGEVDLIVGELDRSGSTIPDEAITAACDAVRDYERVFCYGTGRSGLMLKAFAMRLMQLGLTSYVIGETTTPSMESGDLLILASASGSTESVVAAARSAVTAGADLFVLSSKEKSPLAEIRRPDVVIESGTKFDAGSVSAQPLGSLFEQMLLVFFDAVILRLSSSDEVTYSKMAGRHANIE